MRKFLCILFVSMIAFFSVALAADSPTGSSVTEITVEEPAPPIEIIVLPPAEIPPEIGQIIEDITAEYHVTVSYILPDGTPVEEPISHIAIVGEMVSVDLPEIPGYVPVVLYPAVEMPGRDVEYAVIYLPEELYSSLALFFTVEDYDTPLGLGYTVLNVGVCIE